MTVQIERVTDARALARGAHLFDEAVDDSAARRFLSSPTHHLLFAYRAGDADLAHPIGMISGVETTHPDHGTEMFLYELGVDDEFRRQGVATALVHALADLARDRGCYGMWVGTEPDNEAALATYRAAVPSRVEPFVSFTWTFDDPA
ncbi:GNAT family N-acetyltransferase [Herbiconiux daphne]|uniref:GNAT family N-acetyltransferase n=1 Tax=Herbiconiux daphne TaxID=2970914 RepID=A0ABT2H411_9MICO|nr:GNAT family N-acetyltransferase [Herbiconiux daphne]MCS5734680.1 GNAT family N-acetyltransferase [Herbiconiux daphne]